MVRFSLEELENEFVILAIQGTTELDYTGKRNGSNIGCMDYVNRRGLYLHNHFLSVLLGLFSQRFIQRSAESLGESKDGIDLPIEEKKSYRWLTEFNFLKTSKSRKKVFNAFLKK